jgi:hypothetical protein
MSTTGEVPVAHIVLSADEMDRLLADRPACWQWAAFVSVVYQCTRRIDERRNVTMDQAATSLRSGREVALFVRSHLRECDELIRECDRFMRAPAFMQAFGAAGDDASADPEAIIDAALRLMGYYERHLEMAEECAVCEALDDYDDLLRDCTELLVTPVRDFGAFMKGVMSRFDEMTARAHAGDDVIVLKPVLLRTTTDAALMWSILDRVNDIR